MSAQPTMPWPLGTAEAAPEHHRVIHIFTSRWSRRDEARAREVPASWAEAEHLRAVAAADRGHPLAAAFRGFGHLERQYSRVQARMPTIIGTPLAVVVPHEFGGRRGDARGHVLVARLAGGQLLVCLSLEVDATLEQLPSALLLALAQGGALGLRVIDADGVEETTLEAAVHRVVCSVAPLAAATSGPDGPRLLVASEMHTMVIARAGDETALDDEVLVRRLLGRLRDQDDALDDPAILWPGEFNRLPQTFGAIRPGASLLAGQNEPVYRNAFVSALLLLGATSLLREARDEAYDVLDAVNDLIKQPRHRWSLVGASPYEAEQSRVAVVTIAVAFQVETHLDIRRVVSDAYLASFHQCLASALAIPASVEATARTTARLESAIAAAGTRWTARNAFVLTFAAAGVIGVATLVLDLIK